MKKLLLSLLSLSFTSAHADWLQFRGPGATAVSTEAAVPAEQLKIAWTADLPGRGLSAPIIVGQRVFVTCASGPEQETLHVFCFDVASGKKKWERSMRSTGRTMTHPKTSVAAATPCSDGERVFALFSSNDLFAFDLDGNLLWLRGLTYDYANASNSLGMAQSPVVLDGTLVVQSENDSESFAAGLDVASGRNKWKLDRPKAANWSSATIWNNVVALQSSKGILGVDPGTGKTMWDYADGASTTPSSVVSHGVLYAVSHGITALSPENGAVTQLWRHEKLNPGTASPLVLGDHLYVVNGAGVLIKASLKNGDELWKLRLKGPFSGSPVAAGNRIHIVNERGIFQTIDPSVEPEGKVTQEIELKETVLTTPAIADGAIFVRSDSKLWMLK
ncbi:MAG: PQQ-binding-like beta-propeller repeat protein [Verrucomicrobiaceae bacterium]|nr:PQQ-binding-like beta-propeller repeat protein [Verrucomicrobiaceae bacterium]